MAVGLSPKAATRCSLSATGAIWWGCPLDISGCSSHASLTPECNCPSPYLQDVQNVSCFKASPLPVMCTYKPICIYVCAGESVGVKLGYICLAPKVNVHPRPEVEALSLLCSWPNFPKKDMRPSRKGWQQCSGPQRSLTAELWSWQGTGPCSRAAWCHSSPFYP